MIEAGSVAAGSFAVTRAVRASPLQVRSVDLVCITLGLSWSLSLMGFI